jgi:hypothetical protein
MSFQTASCPDNVPRPTGQRVAKRAKERGGKEGEGERASERASERERQTETDRQTERERKKKREREKEGGREREVMISKIRGGRKEKREGGIFFSLSSLSLSEVCFWFVRISSRALSLSLARARALSLLHIFSRSLLPPPLSRSLLSLLSLV